MPEEAPVSIRNAAERDVPSLLALINDYAGRGLLLPRTEVSLRARLHDFVVAVSPTAEGDEVMGTAALSPLGPGLGEVRSLAVRAAFNGRGLGRAIVWRLLEEAEDRGFVEVLALTRRVSFFEGLGFVATRRERFLDKLQADCRACPKNLCCDEVAMVRLPATAEERLRMGSDEGSHQEADAR